MRDFVGEWVNIVTDLSTTVSNENGELLTLPLVYEGLVIDADKDSILLGVDKDPPRLIFRAHVVSVELVDEGAVADDPLKPKKKDMN